MSRIGPSRVRLLSVRIVGLYFLLSLVWIRVSDLLVARVTDNAEDLTRLQSIKGWLFILLTGILLYVLITQALNESRRSTQEIARSKVQLDLIMDQIPAVLWTTDRDLVVTSAAGAGMEAVHEEVNELIGRPLIESLDERTQEHVIPAVEEALAGSVASYVVELFDRTYDTTVVPLRSIQGEVTGAIALSVDITDRMETERNLMNSVEDLEKMNLQRDRLVRHLVKAEQEERDRIAIGIHDDSIQKITSAAMALDLLIMNLEEGEGRTLAERARARLAEAISSLRTLVFDLKPLELENDRVATALRLLLERSAADDGFAFEVEDRVSTLPPSTRHVIYGIAQEAIMNARKHAQPSRIHVRLDDQDAGVRVSVSDDGPGFDTQQPRDPYHFGIKNMKERAEMVGGWCHLSSEPNKGTTVEFWVPAEAHISAERVS